MVELKDCFSKSIDELKTLINGNKNEVINSFTTKFTEIEKQFQVNDERMTKLEQSLAGHNTAVDKLTKRVESLELENTKLKAWNVPTCLKKLEEKVEERTNRQLRETLIIKDVPEEVEKETWDETKNLLAQVISDNMDDVSFEFAYGQIKRTHRENKKTDEKGTKIREGKRRIFAAMHSWKFCERMKEVFRLKCVTNKDFNISVEQKYGPLTTWRRFKALERRKDLIERGIISSGFVAYPAKLMVNYPGERKGDKKYYKLYEDFSEVEVVYARKSH
ncbi:MAG: hypothetical protein HRT87_10955 [Legionellales bacterium]|nr:hypothetical protein [Legionellales bacterium]